MGNELFQLWTDTLARQNEMRVKLGKTAGIIELPTQNPAPKQNQKTAAEQLRERAIMQQRLQQRQTHGPNYDPSQQQSIPNTHSMVSSLKSSNPSTDPSSGSSGKSKDKSDGKRRGPRNAMAPAELASEDHPLYGQSMEAEAN